MTNFLFGLASPIAYLVVFIFLLLCGTGNPLPEDTILIAAGYLAYTEVVDIYYIMVICYIGVVCGDTFLYFIGRKYGQRVIEHSKFLKLIPIHRVNKIRCGFHCWGRWMVFFARFLVGFRSPTFLLSGVMKLPFREFVFIDCLSGLISVPLFVGLGYLFGSHVEVIRRDVSKVKSWMIAGAVVLIVLFFARQWFKSRKGEDDMEAKFLGGR